MADYWTFIFSSIPALVILGMRHALEVDHITAIDNLVRLHNATKRARWVGTGFSVGHILSVLGEMIFIICVVRGIVGTDNISFWGGIIGAIGIGIIGITNLCTMKKWGKTGSAMLAAKIQSRTGVFGPFGSSLATGMVFGLGFDTATQISAITLSAVASATLGTQVAMIFSGFFALGMIPIDTLDSFVLRSAFSKIFSTRGFRYLSYALSTVAITIAAIFSYATITHSNIMPMWVGPSMAVGIIIIAFGYGAVTRKKRPYDMNIHHKESK